jgi:hypothetical protein
MKSMFPIALRNEGEEVPLCWPGALHLQFRESRQKAMSSTVNMLISEW